MATINLNDPLIRSLRCETEKTIEHRDSRVPGLVIRVTPAATKTWSVQYRVNGRLRRLTIGEFPMFSLADARQRAREALYSVAIGKDPAAEKIDSRRAETFADLAKE